LVERQAVGGCDLCLQACPHQAISIDTAVLIGEACTGCGLCVQVCPTGALEYPVEPTLASLHRQSREDGQAEFFCSQVEGSGERLTCLAQLSEAALLAAAVWKVPLQLRHGRCSDCLVGSDQVLAQLRTSADRVQEKVAPFGFTLELELREGAADLDRSRREALREFGRRSFSAAYDLLPAPLRLAAGEEAGDFPKEWIWRYRALRAAASSSPLPWPVPAASDRCVLCPVCSNVCPTGALRREVVSDGGELVLELLGSACTGCSACVASCPTSALELVPAASAEQLQSWRELRRGRLE
jgi:ferredoxin